jgi:hypothetical protein
MSTADALIAFLRAEREGLVLFDGEIERLRYVIDGINGVVVAPVAPSVLRADSIVLCVPDESPDVGPEAQLMLVAEEPGRDGQHARDRWAAWFGPPRSSTWLHARIESAKWEGRMIDDAIELANSWAANEPALCRLLNADRARLEAACLRARGRATSGAFAVGVDPSGIDVRTAVSAWPMRVAFEQQQLASAESPEGLIERWLQGATK